MGAVRHLYTLSDMAAGRVEALLDRAERLRGKRDLKQLAGRTVVLLFLNPSLRTRVSMELAAKYLGAHVVTLQGEQGIWSLEAADGAIMRGSTAEHVKEAAGVLSRYGDVVAVRAFGHGTQWAEVARDPVMSAFMRYSQVPCLNLESALYHPCQALADLLTMRRRCKAGRKPRVVLTWADHPLALPLAVANSFALGVTRMGWDLTIARPEGYDLPDEVMATCRAHAEVGGSELAVTSDRLAALDGAHYVYAKSWRRLDSYGDTEGELADRTARGLEAWRVDAEAMARTDDGSFMHCLPVRRNVVVTDEVLDSDRSLVFEQAENRLYVQQALLLDLLGHSGWGIS